jgi:DnaK suppressor protein
MTKNTTPKARRYAALRTMLEQRRATLMDEMHGKIRDVRTAGSDARRIRDSEAAEIDHEDIDLTLIQLKSDMLARIGTALQRVERGTYGDCSACGLPIARSRLAALPFATRCLNCEQARETADADARLLALRRLHPSYRTSE